MNFRAGAIGFFALVKIVTASDNIVPRPLSTQVGNAIFQLPASLIVSSDSASKPTVAWLKKLFAAAGTALAEGPQASAQISVAIDQGLDSLGDEGYRLSINATRISIASAHVIGQFYAMQTLRQMLPAEIERPGVAVPKPVRLSSTVILDKPRHLWRGIMLDPARRFLPISYLRQTIDRMALYKLNRLHLHLSDDQGWRLEIKSWPRLATYGGQTQVGGGPGGFYTQAEMADLIRYADARHIVIVPEFDMPGHTQAALASYPQLACAGADTSLNTGTKVGFSTLCVGQPAVTKFLDDVMREVASLFPGPYIHIGGDESKATSAADYVTFIQAAEKTIEGNGKIMIGWDDITTTKQSAATLTQVWHAGLKGSINSYGLYLDHADKTGDTSTHSGTVVSFQSAYGAVSGSLGVEAPVWGEYLQNLGLVDRQLFPRALSVAELGWVDTNANFAEFKIRVADQGIRLDDMGIQWYKSDSTVAWKFGTIYATASTVFDGFIPSGTTGNLRDTQRMDAGAAKNARDGGGDKVTTVNVLGRRLSPFHQKGF